MLGNTPFDLGSLYPEIACQPNQYDRCSGNLCFCPPFIYPVHSLLTLWTWAISLTSWSYQIPNLPQLPRCQNIVTWSILADSWEVTRSPKRGKFAVCLHRFHASKRLALPIPSISAWHIPEATVLQAELWQGTFEQWNHHEVLGLWLTIIKWLPQLTLFGFLLYNLDWSVMVSGQHFTTRTRNFPRCSALCHHPLYAVLCSGSGGFKHFYDIQTGRIMPLDHVFCWAAWNHSDLNCLRVPQSVQNVAETAVAASRKQCSLVLLLMNLHRMGWKGWWDTYPFAQTLDDPCKPSIMVYWKVSIIMIHHFLAMVDMVQLGFVWVFPSQIMVQ